jgi:hypothetical protein
MKRKIDIDELETFFQDGIVNDLMYATRHYIIWRTIGENFSRLKSISNKNKDNLFGHIQSSDQDLAVLSLAKIFDSKDRRHTVRSINEFLDIEFKPTSYFPLDTKDYIEFSLLRSRLNIIDFPLQFETPVQLALFFKGIFNNELIINKIKKIQYVRNKFLAHNEHNVEFQKLDSFWSDFLDLLDFLKLFVSLFGVTVLGSHYFQFEDFKEGSFHYSVIHQVYWLVEEIEKLIGKENFNYWWIDSTLSESRFVN